MEGAPGWFVTILQGYGLAGIVIFVLGWIVFFMYRSSLDVNNSRLGERDVLIKALESNTTAIRENAHATENRNSITQDLAEAIGKQAGAFDLFIQKTELQNESFREKMRDMVATVDAMSEASRVNTGILKDVRDTVTRQK